MLTVGEIKRIYTDINNTVICDVDISLFKSTLTVNNADNNLIGSIYTASISTIPGIYMPYKVGDVVFVSFADNEITEAVILGKIHKNLPENNDSSSYAYFKSLNVTDKVVLPESTTIGTVTYDEIKSSLLKINNLQSKSAYVNYNVYSDNEELVGSCIRNNVVRDVYRINKEIYTGSKSVVLYTFADDVDILSINYIMKNGDTTYESSYFSGTVSYSNKVLSYNTDTSKTFTSIDFTVEYMRSL